MLWNRFEMRAALRGVLVGAAIAGGLLLATDTPADAARRPIRPYRPSSTGRPCPTPEIDASALRGLVTLVSGGILIFADRRRRS
ncbi:MAG: hypothetical protein U0807_09250 [Candidatus Binatia bacterium]